MSGLDDDEVVIVVEVVCMNDLIVYIDDVDVYDCRFIVHGWVVLLIIRCYWFAAGLI